MHQQPLTCSIKKMYLLCLNILPWLHNKGHINTVLTQATPNPNYKVPRRMGNQERRQLFCDFCKMTWHTVQKCCKTHGYPLCHKFYKGRKVTLVAIHTEPSVFNANYNSVPWSESYAYIVQNSYTPTGTTPTFT